MKESIKNLPMILACILTLTVLIQGCVVIPNEESRACQNSAYEKKAQKAAAALERGDMETAYRILLGCAELGNAAAQFDVAMLISMDEDNELLDVDAETKNARMMVWVRRAAENGLSQATIMLANAYERGWYGYPEHSDLAQCWHEAIDGEKEIIQKCLSLESSLDEELAPEGE